ncbi:MAG: hypothetical protein NTU95_00415 [Methanothrix sp.]|nr:hypothetical protein [Methanothrix sp.]
MMRRLAAIVAFLTLSTIATSFAADSNCLNVKEVTMRLEGDNATFELNYTLDTFTRFYVTALGCRYLEPELISFLGGYSDVMLIRADIDGAALQVVGAGKYNSGYYLFDSVPFGSKEKPLKDGIARFSVVYPGGRVRTFYNVTATQNVFSQAAKPPASSARQRAGKKQG